MKRKSCYKCGGRCHGNHAHYEGNQRAGFTMSAWSWNVLDMFLENADDVKSRIISAEQRNSRVAVMVSP